MSNPLKDKQEVYNSSLKDFVENEVCPSCGEKVITKNPKKDNFLDFFDSIYCENEDMYFSYMAFVSQQMEKKDE